MPYWEQALIAAAALVVPGIAGRRLRRPRLRLLASLCLEAALVFALFALWQLVRMFTVTSTVGAQAHGQAVWALERAWHLPNEAAAQQLILPHGWLVRAANLYYATLHFPVTNAFLLWLFIRHRDRYSPVRWVLVLVTSASLLVQLVPVAPPRLLPGLGLVDTGLRYHQSVYPAGGLGLADQLSAMPSVHVAWAVLVAAGAIWASRRRWRWLVILYPLATTFVVTITGNHYWLDGAAGVALLALAVAAVAGAYAAAGRYQSARVRIPAVAVDADQAPWPGVPGARTSAARSVQVERG